MRRPRSQPSISSTVTSFYRRRYLPKSGALSTLSRANPLGTFKVFRTYDTILPLCAVLAVYFFASAVYPAIWSFWGIAKFGWSETTIGLTLAAFGLGMALVQGFLTQPAVNLLGESRVVVICMALAAVAAVGYGLAPGLAAVLVLLVINAPEGLVNPLLGAIMSKQVPADAQGELQGGIASIMSVAMLTGTLFFSYVFGVFTRPNMHRPEPECRIFHFGCALCRGGGDVYRHQSPAGLSINAALANGRNARASSDAARAGCRGRDQSRSLPPRLVKGWQRQQRAVVSHKSAPGTIAIDGFQRVLRAGRQVAAPASHQQRQGVAIGEDRRLQHQRSRTRKHTQRGEAISGPLARARQDLAAPAAARRASIWRMASSTASNTSSVDACRAL